MIKSTALSVFVVLSSGVYTALGESLRGKVKGFARGRPVERPAAHEVGEHEKRDLKTRTEVFVTNNSDKGISFEYEMESHPDWPSWIDHHWTKYISPGETEKIGTTRGDAIFYKYWLPWFEDVYTCNGEAGDFCRLNFGDNLGGEVTYCVNEFSDGLGQCVEPENRDVPEGTEIFVKNNSDEAIYFQYQMESHPDMPHWLDQHWTKLVHSGETKRIGTTKGNAMFYKYWTPWWGDVYDCDGQEDREVNDFCKMNLGDSQGEQITYCVNDFYDGLEENCAE